MRRKRGAEDSAFPLVAARFAGAALSFFVPILLARALSLESYGTYKQIFLVAQTLSLVLPFGITQGLFFFLPQKPRDGRHLGNALLYSAAAGAVLGGALWSSGALLGSLLGNPGIAAYAPQLALFTAGSIASYPLEIGLIAGGQVRRAAGVYVVSDVTRAGAVLAVLLVHPGLAAVTWTLALHALARAAVTWLLLAPRDRPLAGVADFRGQVAYALPFGLAMVVDVFQGNLHQYIVSNAVGPALFAIYAAGCFQPPIAEMLHTPVSEILMVRLGHERGRIAPAFRESVQRLSLLLLPISGFLVFAAPDVVLGLFGPRFAGASGLLRTTALIVGLQILPLDAVLRARGRTREIFISYAVKAAVAVPLAIWLVRALGLWGGVLSWLAAELAGKVMLSFAVARLSRSEEPGARLLPAREVASAALSTAVAGAAVLAASPAAHAALPGLLALGALGLLFVALYALLLAVLGFSLSSVLRLRGDLYRRPQSWSATPAWGARRLAKLAVLGAFRWAGAFAIARLLTRGQVRIVAYHSVSAGDEHEFWPEVFMRRSRFESRMELLARGGYRVVPLEKARGELSGTPVVLTFDDGFSTTLSRALPVMKARGFRPTVFVTTYYVEKNVPVFRLAVQYMFWRTARSSLRLAAIGMEGPDAVFDNLEERRALAWRVIEWAETLPSEAQRVTVAERLGAALEVDYRALRRARTLTLMSRSDLARLSRDADLGLHTHRHRMPADPGALRREVLKNKRVLEPLAGRAIEHFACPDGEWAPEHQGVLQDAGVTMVTTCDSGLAAASEAGFALPRISDGDHVSQLEFEAEVSGFMELVRMALGFIRRWTARRSVVGELEPATPAV